MGRVALGLLLAVLVTALAARVAVEATVRTGPEPAMDPWSQERMEFVAWNGERWTAWIRDDVFEHRPQNEGRWSPHANRSLAFIDWEGRPWQARVDGDEFLLALRGDWSGAVERSIAIRYVDWKGRRQFRTVSQLRR